MAQLNFYIILTIILIVISPPVLSQDLILTSGVKSKKIRTGTFIEVAIPLEPQGTCDRCNYRTLGGQFLGRRGDSMELRVTEEYVQREAGEDLWKGVYTAFHGKTDSIALTAVPLSAIHAITKKGRKKIRDVTTGQTIGGILLLLGAGSLASSPLAGEKTGRVAGVGGLSLITGMIVGLASGQPKFILNPALQPATPTRLWKIAQ